MHDRNAYHLIRAQLKQRKMHAKYKSIFTIIYALGGRAPKITSRFKEQCMDTYRALEHFFKQRRDQFRRKSMPSVYMLLDIVLRQNGHEPYYFIP